MRAKAQIVLGTLLLTAATLTGVAAAGEPASASPFPAWLTRTYSVTVTNVTTSQVMNPVMVIVGEPSLHLFTVGQPASDALAAVAEDADTTGIVGMLDGLVGSGVDSYAIADGPLPPGQSVTLDVTAAGGCRALTLVSMLVTTNDAFAGVNAVPLSTCGPGAPFNLTGGVEVWASAYDAGTEANTELCSEIPGPPCGSHFVRHTEGAEGFVHVHGGIHGVGDLDPAMFDWRNPVARLWIERAH